MLMMRLQKHGRRGEGRSGRNRAGRLRDPVGAGLGLTAADHLNPPGRTDPAVDPTPKPDRPADLADLYAWYTDEMVNLVLTFAGPQAASQPVTYDPDVLHTINISNAPSRTSVETPFQIRFGPRAAEGEFGVQVVNVSGTNGPIEGFVETNPAEDGVMVRAGLFDDPFFLDLQGPADCWS